MLSLTVNVNSSNFAVAVIRRAVAVLGFVIAPVNVTYDDSLSLLLLLLLLLLLFLFSH